MRKTVAMKNLPYWILLLFIDAIENVFKVAQLKF